MATPAGMRCLSLAGGSVHVYSSPARIVLQLRVSTASEIDLLRPSAKVAVELPPQDVLSLAMELLDTLRRLESYSPPGTTGG